MSKVIEVTDQTFAKEVLEAEFPTEVDFWAPWCDPCSDACLLKAIRMV
jgi:thioredoxin 1